VVQELHPKKLMNELEFKLHLKDLVHGQHHPEEHDWVEPAPTTRKAAGAPKTRAKRKAPKKPAKRR